VGGWVCCGMEVKMLDWVCVQIDGGMGRRYGDTLIVSSILYVVPQLAISHATTRASFHKL